MSTVLDKLPHSIVRSSEDDTVKGLTGTLLNLVKFLLYCHKHIAVSREHLELCTCIASLPWVCKVSSQAEYATMVPCGSRWGLPKLKQLASVIAKHMDSGVCLEVLTLFPPEFYTKWRVGIFNETLVRATNLNQRVETRKREMFSQKSVRRFVGDSSAFVMGAMFLASALNRNIFPGISSHFFNIFGG